MLSCILLKFYIKPQLNVHLILFLFVVSYWNSTSNHNRQSFYLSFGCVVSYWNSTSNHNNSSVSCRETYVVSYWNSTSNHNSGSFASGSAGVVSYWNSTSNHNPSFDPTAIAQLYLIEILHQTTTRLQLFLALQGCILLKFYIKPQLALAFILIQFVVSYWNSTSNHNLRVNGLWFLVLYLIEILHQTTTSIRVRFSRWCCILLKFYIKPQPWREQVSTLRVVSYWNSTSNHNVGPHIDW